MDREEDEILAAVRKFYAGNHNIETAFSIFEKRLARTRDTLTLLIEEITDLEGREGMSDADWIEQVVAFAQAQRAALQRDDGT